MIFGCIIQNVFVLVGTGHFFLRLDLLSAGDTPLNALGTPLTPR